MSQVDPQLDRIRPVQWRDGALHLLDQRWLPDRHESLILTDSDAVAAAITDMVVRGAPAIGITAAFGTVLAARSAWQQAGADWRTAIEPALDRLRAARPTAINLAWAIDKLAASFARIDGDPEPELLAQAQTILDDDIAANHAMGALGAAEIGQADGVLTHCNAGALATGGYGTALGVIRSAWAGQRIKQVFADETRPWLQGARLTAWELLHDGIATDLLVEGAAATLMAQGLVQWVVVGSDRIAGNGDVANKIGTYSLAVLAREHGVRFMVAAPLSTIDRQAASGADIPIERRAADEILQAGGQRVAAEGAGAWNPVFDVTPARLVDCIVTERGVVHHPDKAGIDALFNAS